MSIIEHGDWARYYPDPRPEGAPPNAMFTRRNSDARDWYQYVNASTANFQPNSVKMTVYRQAANGPSVGAAVFDPTMLWPDQALIVEDTGYSGDDPQADYGRRIYDPVTKTFSDPPPLELPPSPVLTELEARIAALEAKAEGT